MATSPNNLPAETTLEATLHAAGNDYLWEALDGFLRQLRDCDDVRRQVRLTLETLLEATHADLIFLSAPDANQPIEQCGSVTMPPEWCRLMMRLMLTTAHGIRRDLLVSHCNMPKLNPSPRSVSMVQLSRSRSAWIVAVQFTGRPFNTSTLKLMRFARRLLQHQQQHSQVQHQLRETLIGLVRCLSATLDARDEYTWGHSERVARIAVRVAEQMGVKQGERNDLYLGGLLHDIGKIGVRDDVLRKAGALSPEERQNIEKHTVIGDAILSHVTQLSHLRPIVRSHHEQWNGNGYPDRLAGTFIPLPARILSVADACDAMLSDRPYRKGMPVARVEAIFQEGAGKQWDADIVHHFMACRNDVYGVYQRPLGDSVFLAVEQALQQTNEGKDNSETNSSMPSLCVPSGR